MRKLLKYMILCIISLSLTGCMKYNISITVNKDLTSETSMELLVEDSLLEAMGMTSEEFYESFEEEYLDSESLQDASITQINDGEWSGVSITGLSLEDSMTTAITEEEIDGKDSIVVCIPINDIKDVMDFSDSGYSLEDLKEAGMEITLNITMPATPTTNFGEVDNKTVTVDLLEIMYNDSEENIIVSSTIPDYTMIYVGIGAVVIATGVFVLIKKKRNLS
ncbi:MAG: hypothetical protein LUG46_00170 [Erysipelotrichaceae bacterium]|nr:hypothetical protein [Erysipelotrichaceae bacterium]